jgi:hypothetical protein
MYDAVVARFGVITAEGSGLMKLLHQIKGLHFVEAEFIGSVILATAALVFRQEMQSFCVECMRSCPSFLLLVLNCEDIRTIVRSLCTRMRPSFF